MRQKDKEARHLLSAELLDKILEECGERLNTLQFYFQGEPLMNRHLPELIMHAKRYGIYTIVSTNAQLLDSKYAEALVQSGLDKIIVSIDGFTQDSYEQYRQGGSLEKALNGLSCLSEAKKRLHSPIKIELQCLYLKSNEDEWAFVRKNYRQLGATRLSMKTAQFYDYEHGNILMPTDNRYCRYKQGRDGLWHRKKPLRNHCFRLWSGCVVDATGQVLPCCFDKDRHYVTGNIIQQSLWQIWTGERIMAFRKRVLRRRKETNICLNCTE